MVNAGFKLSPLGSVCLIFCFNLKTHQDVGSGVKILLTIYKPFKKPHHTKHTISRKNLTKDLTRTLRLLRRKRYQQYTCFLTTEDKPLWSANKRIFKYKNFSSPLQTERKRRNLTKRKIVLLVSETQSTHNIRHT